MTASLNDRLAKLQDDYTYQVNALVDQGREDLAKELSDRYVEDAAQLLAEVDAA